MSSFLPHQVLQDTCSHKPLRRLVPPLPRRMIRSGPFVQLITDACQQHAHANFSSWVPSFKYKICPINSNGVAYRELSKLTGPVMSSTLFRGDLRFAQRDRRGRDCQDHGFRPQGLRDEQWHSVHQNKYLTSRTARMIWATAMNFCLQFTVLMNSSETSIT